MKTAFVDANIFLRFFTVDEVGQHQKAEELFRKAAAGKVNLLTGPPVLFEIAWTLRAAYRRSKEEVLLVLSAICSLPGLTLTDRSLVERAIELARQSSQEFADAYIAVSAEQAEAEIATFNRKHFDKVQAKPFPIE
jgi:predicted nucleic acid-binding protein